MRLLALAALVSSLCLPLRAEDQKDHFKLIHAADLAAAMKTDHAPSVYDANTKKVRSKYGVIPGATLLSSSSKYDVKALPAEKTTPLVFYCANTMCMASHQAAARAADAGYTDVSVMSDGIMGWKDAGRPTEPAKKAPTLGAKKG